MKTDMLDCIQANLAVLCGPERYPAMGAPLRFEPRPGPLGLPTVERPVAEQLAEAEALLGLVRRDTRRDLDPAGLREMAGACGTVYAIGDSFDMPWLPYHGHRHMEHSFLVSLGPDGADVTDAYDNDTAWGPAKPGQWSLAWERLPRVGIAIAYDITADPPGPSPTVHIGPHDDYITAYAAHRDRLAAMEQLAVETWLMLRSRRLHAAYRGQPAGEHLRRWESIATTAFIALRRAQRGKPEPTTLLPDLGAALTADRDVFTTH